MPKRSTQSIFVLQRVCFTVVQLVSQEVIVKPVPPLDIAVTVGPLGTAHESVEISSQELAEGVCRDPSISWEQRKGGGAGGVVRGVEGFGGGA